MLLAVTLKGCYDYTRKILHKPGGSPSEGRQSLWERRICPALLLCAGMAQVRKSFAAGTDCEYITQRRIPHAVQSKLLDKAKASAVAVVEKPPKYFKVVCEQCGKVMFIKEGDAVFATM